MGAIAHLNDYQLQQGMRRVVLSGKATAPSLPEFVKLCRTVGEVEGLDEPQSHSSQLQLTQEHLAMDNWAIAGNQHLLAYILQKFSEKRCFSPDETRILVRFKNLWVDQIRLDATETGVPVGEQKEVWAECMRRAETEIANAA